ncbi:PF13084 domain protein [Bacteriovorax sp. BSW11_IV]|uniref:DUF3943 domain-containing protein n=1 Tax=Bacteriovorax sp. BSW11_IV TaxID=1353529 RepID=UPI00038A08E2|nr:DUF3943 domain-containing protein [Bacteriovorax sp. BSW11_IV]EQC50281.1 PF13084 domain protein [Bacteriovorax sp. BSW11_IV]
MKLKSLLALCAVVTTCLSTTIRADEQKIDEWLFNPVSRFVTKDQWQDILEDSREQQRERLFQKANMITIDTRDQKSCREVQRRLINNPDVSRTDIATLCEYDEENPYSTIVVVDGEYRRPITLENLSPEQQKIVKQTRNFTVLGAGMVGLLYMMPESVTKWDKDEIGKIGSKWKENVKEGPVVDKDDWAINYIGHPYSGAIYYVVARHAGLNKMASFGYSVFMSTIFWEYGFEATAEVPSIQDLIVTPIIGSLMGELFIHWEKQIESNNGKLLGSKKLGSVAMAFMDPAGALLDGVNNVFEKTVIKDAKTYWFNRPHVSDPINGPHFSDSGILGIGIELKF